MVNKKLFLAFLTISSAMFLNSCFAPEKITQLYGTYIVDYDMAKEELILKNDGTFIQKVIMKSTSKLEISEGTWTYNKKNGYITFHENFMLVLDGYKKFNPNFNHPKKREVDFPVQNILGILTIECNDGIAYKKISKNNV